MTQHVSKICQSGMYSIKVLNCLRNVIDSDTKIILVKSLVLNKLDYCNSLLASAPNYLIEKIQKVMNSSIRFIYNLKKSTSITPYMKRAHFLPVQHRIKYKLCCETFKVLNNISPKYLHDFLTPDFPKRTGLRTSNDFALVKTSNCEKSVSHAMCNEWNKLPQELRIKGKLKDFKSALKTHYFNLYYDWVPNLITNHGCFK